MIHKQDKNRFIKNQEEKNEFIKRNFDSNGEELIKAVIGHWSLVIGMSVEGRSLGELRRAVNGH